MAGPWPSVLLSYTEGHLSDLPGVCWEGREGSGQKLHSPPKYLRGLCCGASWGLSSGLMCRRCFWDSPQNVTLFHPPGPACPVPCLAHALPCPQTPDRDPCTVSGREYRTVYWGPIFPLPQRLHLQAPQSRAGPTPKWGSRLCCLSE